MAHKKDHCGETPLLQIKGVSKRFGGVGAVHGVSFDLFRGEVLGIIGPNGSGKTTLVNIITGFIRPDSGKVIFRGKEITGLPAHRVAGLGIARTFQMVRPFSRLPAFRNLIIPLYSPRVRRLAGGRYGDRDSESMDLLEEVGFERDSPVPHKGAGVLPQGYLKRLELARCLALRPDLMILDELFSGLSSAEVAGILPLLEKLKVMGISLLMVEHRLKELFSLAGKAVVMNFGEVIARGTRGEIMNHEGAREAYLGVEMEGDARD